TSLTIMKPDNASLNGTLKFRIAKYSDGEDGRTAFGDPVLNVPGTAVFGTTLFETTDTISLTPGANATRQFRFVLPPTEFPQDLYFARLELFGNVEDQISLDFTGIPAFDEAVTMPSTVSPLEPISVQAALINQTSFSITNL